MLCVLAAAPGESVVGRFHLTACILQQHGGPVEIPHYRSVVLSGVLAQLIVLTLPRTCVRRRAFRFSPRLYCIPVQTLDVIWPGFVFNVRIRRVKQFLYTIIKRQVLSFFPARDYDALVAFRIRAVFAAQMWKVFFELIDGEREPSFASWGQSPRRTENTTHTRASREYVCTCGTRAHVETYEY